MDTVSDQGNHMLLFSSTDDNANLSSSAESWERTVNIGGGHLLWLPQRRKTTVSFSPGIRALTTVVFLALVYLLIRCVRHLALGNNVGEPSRKLAGGGRSQQPPVCFPRASVEEDNDEWMNDEQMVSMSSRGFVGEGAFHLTEQQAAEWCETRQVPVETRRVMQTALERMQRIASYCSDLVTQLPCEQFVKVLRHVVRLETLDLAIFSLVPPSLEDLRQNIYNVYIGMLERILNDQSGEVDQKTRSWMTDSLAFLLNSRMTRAVKQQPTLKKHVNTLLSGPGLAIASSFYVEQSLVNLNSALKPSGQPPSLTHFEKELLEKELTILGSLRSLRIRQVLGMSAARAWLAFCTVRSGAWTAFSPEELEAARDAQLPRFETQLEDIHRAVERAGGSRLSPGEGSDDVELQQLTEHGSQQWGETRQKILLYPELTPETQDVFFEMFHFLKQSEDSTNALERSLDSEVGLELVHCVTRLAAVELGASMPVPDSVEPHRKQVVQLYIDLASRSLNRNQSRTDFLAVQELQDLLRLLKTEQARAHRYYPIKVDKYNKTMSTQAKASHRVGEAMALILEDLKTKSVGICRVLEAPMMQQHLNALRALASLRIQQIRRMRLLSHWLVKAQSNAKVQVLFSPDERPIPGEYHTKQILAEIKELLANTWNPGTGHLQSLVTPGISEGVQPAVAHACLQIREPVVQRHEEGVAASHPGVSPSAREAGAALAAKAQRVQTAYGCIRCEHVEVTGCVNPAGIGSFVHSGGRGDAGAVGGRSSQPRETPDGNRRRWSLLRYVASPAAYRRQHSGRPKDMGDAVWEASTVAHASHGSAEGVTVGESGEGRSHTFTDTVAEAEDAESEDMDNLLKEVMRIALEETAEGWK